MGIDARMLLKLQTKPTDMQLQQWSWRLCESIGAERFMIRDGLLPEEHRVKQKEWHAAFEAHPLYESYAASRSIPLALGSSEERDRIHKKIFSDVGAPPECRRRALELTNYIYPLDDEESEIAPEYRAPGRCYTQDADPIFAKPGEWFVEVSLWSRFYGIGYERGDLLTLCAIAEWCEANLAPCEVWYGGDSSGCAAEHWPEAERAKLRRHLYGSLGREYFHYGLHGELPGPRPKPCSLCVGQGDFSEFGHGPSYLAVHCAGCDKSFTTVDKGKTWKLKDKNSLF